LKLHIIFLINLKEIWFKPKIVSTSAYNSDPLHGCQMLMGFLLIPINRCSYQQHVHSKENFKILCLNQNSKWELYSQVTKLQNKIKKKL
jgi:hypothetical protein